MEFLKVDRENDDHEKLTIRLTFRLGLQFRAPLQPLPPPESRVRFRYVRIQVAWPPPPRVDGTSWEDGLRTSGGPFHPQGSSADLVVTPLRGVAPLGQPDPGTIMLDRWLAVPAVSPAQALTRAFTLDSTGPAEEPLNFLSTFYPPDRASDGTPLTVAGAAYYLNDELKFEVPADKGADGDYVAVSLDRFFPRERPSADYIVSVAPSDKVQTKTDLLESLITPAWSAHPSAGGAAGGAAGATSASR